MLRTRGYAATGPSERLGPYEFDRRDLRAHDALVDIQYCGVCHSDIHQARDEWGGSTFPMVPGHEIVGTVAGVGTAVSRCACRTILTAPACPQPVNTTKPRPRTCTTRA